MNNSILLKFFYDYALEVIVLLTSVIFSGVTGYFKRKKVSTDAINRKNNLYQILIDELSTMSSNNLDINNIIKCDFLYEVVNNDYKYAIDKDLAKELISLKQIIGFYNEFRLDYVAYNIIVRQFIQGFEDLYGSIIDGISYHYDLDGNEYEIEEEVLELKILELMQPDSTIDSLLNQLDGMPTYTIRLDDGIEDYVFEQVIEIYNIAFNSSYEGYKVPKRKMKIAWSGTASEYIAYNYDFKQAYDKDEKVILKNKYRNEIIFLSEIIVKKIKNKILKIVKKYEKEVI